MAGLNFTGNADYKEAVYGKDNIASFEFIPWVLRQCATVKEAKELISRINITNTAFSDNLPVATLHWIVAGRGLKKREALGFIYNFLIGKNI